jgi:hypothetical protein
MLAPGKQAQHARRIGGIGRLTKNQAIDYDHGIGSEDDILRTLSRNRQRLLTSQSLSAFLGALSQLRVFRYVRRLHLECDPGVAQQFLAARRCGGKH